MVTTAACSGCASIISKSEYPVSIRSVPSGATVSVKNRKGSIVHKDSTPTHVSLPSSDGYFRGSKYSLRFEKDGYQPSDMPLSAEFDASYLGNICFGGLGLIGFLLIDPATGAMWQLDRDVCASLDGMPPATATPIRGSKAISRAIAVTHAALTKERAPYGTQRFTISAGGVDHSQLFGPPVTEAWPKDGHQFVVLYATVKTESDEEWKRAVNSVEVVTPDGTNHTMDAWFFNGAYRADGLLAFADGAGLRSAQHTRLMYDMPDPLPDGVKLVVGGQDVGLIAQLVGGQKSAAEPASGAPIQSGTLVYGVVEGLQLRVDAAISSDRTGDDMPFGQEFRIVEDYGDWLLVNVADTETAGWVHKATVCSSEDQVTQMQRIAAIPDTVIFVYNMQGGASSAQVAILEGQLRMGDKRVLAHHSTCVVFNDELGLTLSERSMKGFGAEQSIASPQPWTLYFYCSAEKRFRPVPELIRQGKKLAVGEPPLDEPAVFGFQKASNWPVYTVELRGNNPVRVVNPNEYSVKVGLRSAGRGKDFEVTERGTETVYVPNGQYEVYFRYSTDEEALYKGDDFALNNNGVEVRIVKVVGGNYSIQRIK